MTDYRQFFIDAIANRDFRKEFHGLIESGHDACAELLVAVKHGDTVTDAELFMLAAVIFHADAMGK